jgi:mono/diheme cytochrome c family protein
MPPFAQTLSDAEIAELLTFIRSAWGNSAAPVSQLDVMRYRTGQTD